MTSSPSSGSLLSVHGLQKSFKNRQVVKDVGLSLASGEKIIMPNIHFVVLLNVIIDGVLKTPLTILFTTSFSELCYLCAQLPRIYRFC